MTHISGYDSKFETEVLYFGGNMAVFFGIYTHAAHLRVWILHGNWLNDSS